METLQRSAETAVNYRQIAEALRDEIRAGAYADVNSFPSLTKIMLDTTLVVRKSTTP